MRCAGTVGKSPRPIFAAEFAQRAVGLVGIATTDIFLGQNAKQRSGGIHDWQINATGQTWRQLSTNANLTAAG